MSRKRFAAEHIVNMLRETKVLLNQDSAIGEVWRKFGISEQTYYRWRKNYGGMREGKAKHHMALEKKNVRLKKAVADLSLDRDISHTSLSEVESF